MTLDDVDDRLLAAIEDGIPLSPRPFADVGRTLALSEAEVIRRLQRLIEANVVKRFGVVVRHHELGYTANAMVVWDIPDAVVDDAATRIIRLPFITLCYRRPRRPPLWPYNLFCMIHGRDRSTVLAQIEHLRTEAGVADFAYAVLFSRQQFKQRGARYGAPSLGASV
jgi:DNA-binding Lrp family transcriptional regulator